MASRDKKVTLTKKQTTASSTTAPPTKEEGTSNDPTKLIPANEIKQEFPKSAPTKQIRKPTGLKKKDPKKVVKRTFKINLKAKNKVNAKGKTILTKGKNVVKKTLLKNGVSKTKVIRKKPQPKVDNVDKPPVLEPIYADNNIDKKVVKKKITPKKVIESEGGNYCSISETIESIVSQSGLKPVQKKAVKKLSTKEPSVVDTISESIEDVVRELKHLIKTEDIKKECDTGSDSGKNDKIIKPIKRKPKVDLLKKKLKKENIENELNKIDTSNSKVIDMLDLVVAKTKSSTKIVENRRHSIEKFPITNQDVKIQNATVFSNIPRSISPKNKRQIKLRQSLDSKRNSPYATRSDSPARILRNGKHRKHLHLLDGIDTEYKKRKRLCSDYSGSELSNSKLSGYESDSSFSDLASLHGGENADNTESPPTKESLLKKELLETLENNPPDNMEGGVSIKRSLSLESNGKDIENKIDTNFNLCENEEPHSSPVKIEEDVFMETISPSFKVPEKSIILNIMKQTFNGVIEEQQEIEKRKTRSAAKKDTKDEDEVPGMSTSTFYGTSNEEIKEDPKIEEVIPEPPQQMETEIIEKEQPIIENNNLDIVVPSIIPESIVEEETKENGEIERKVEIVESPESLVIKHQILQALGLQSLKAAEEAKLRKLVPKNDSYTGTLKTVIKLSRNDKKKGGRSSLKMTLAKRGKVHGKDDDMLRTDEDEYKIMKEGSSSTWKAHHGGQSSDTAGAQRKSHYSNRINMDGSSEHTSDGDTNANEEGAGKLLVIPEKASSFSIHPGRLCKDECSYCFGKFGLFDTPCHIAQMKSVDRQNKILAAEKHLTRDSCLCDACYRHVDRKSNTPSYSNNKSVKRNSLVAPGPRQNHCHVLGCGVIATNILRRKWLIKMRKSVCQVINIDLDNPGLHSIPICEEHYNSLEHLMVCAMCKRKLARNHIHYLGPESNDLNTALNEMGVPVKLNDKPVVCKLCRYFASLVLKNAEDRTETNMHFYREYKKRLLHFHDIEIMDEAEAEEPIPAPMKEKEIVKQKKKKSQKNQTLEPPVLEPQIDIVSNEEPKNRVPSTDSRAESPSDILVDYNTLIPNIAMECGGNDIEMTRREISKKSAVSIKRISKTESEKSKKLKHKSDIAVQRLGSNPSISVRQLFPGEEDLPLNGNIEFHNIKERTPEGWEKCVSTIQYDPEVKVLWNDLQKPYGNQSSFLRHLILLEKYFRNGDLVLAPNATHHSVNYSESVQNRLRAYDNIPSGIVQPVQQPVSVVQLNKPQKSVSGIITSKEVVVKAPPTPPPLPPPRLATPPVVTTASISVPKIAPPVTVTPVTVTPVTVTNSFLVPNPAAMVGATVTVTTPIKTAPPTPPPPTPPPPPPPPTLPIKPKLPPGLISLQPGTKIPITPLVKVPQSQKIKFPITKNWRPNLIPIDPAKKPEKKPGLVQVISGGKPYHITLEDYKKMCAIKRTFDLRQKRLQEAQKNPSNSILKNMPARKGLVISKTSSTIVSPTKTDSDPEIENSLEKLDKTVEKLEAKLIDNKLVMPKIPKSLTVIPQTVAAKKTSRPSSPTLLITPKNKPSTVNQLNTTLLNRNMDNNTLVKNATRQFKSPVILDSIDYPSLTLGLDNASGDINNMNHIPSTTDFKSLSMDCEELDNNEKPSFLLLDEQERLRVSNADQFLKCLKIKDATQKVKVVSIFGNTGEGKSHTLNQTFFDGQEVFHTSPEQSSCTLGVWAAYDPQMKVIVLDTEGLLGITKKESQRTRLLLKVLAVSDIIIYRTRTERLQRDMYTFLGGASKAFKEHFQSAIKHVWEKSELEVPPTSLGPSAVIFHETNHTNTLQSSAGVTESPEDILRSRFNELKLDCDSFSSLKYIGIQTKEGRTSFSELKNVLQLELENTTVRSKRNPKVIYLTLKGLNDKFSSEIKNTPPHLYLKEYFTCQMKCQSCNQGCTLSMGHKEEGEPHFSHERCKFQHQFQNCVYLCKHCNKNGERVVVKPHSIQEQSWTNILNYVWSGYVIECKNCGEIYRSRQHWFGNKSPEESAVIAEIVHIWPGERNFLGSHNSAQRMLDGVTMISDAVVSVTSQPTKALTDWVTDKIAPSYWRPNHEINHCHKCKILFASSATKHHCRECGEGFCEQCSSKTQPVPSRGWMYDVRVCDGCYREVPPSLSHGTDDTDVRVRKYGEAVVSSISAVASVLEIPKGIIKDTARPAYWTPDNECLNCEVCSFPFGTLVPLHHCRECGKGVCDDCSCTKKPVPFRGWYEPVRVCDNCLKK